MKVKLSDLMAGHEEAAAAARQVAASVLFADICGSTRLFEEYGDLRARQIETRVLEAFADKTAARGGSVIKTIGDEIMSRFPSAEQAVRAACEMHRAVKDDPMLAELNIACKIGLHYGSVLLENNDVFGDAVNVAARMVSLSKADQIITTRETVGHLPSDLVQITRSLGLSWVRGKQDEMEIFEVIWQDSNCLTQMSSGGQDTLRRLFYSRLILEHRGRRVEVMPSAQPFTMGRGERSNLVVDRDLVSRSHADIQFRQGKFVLADHSTNGTYLLLDNGARFFVRREEFALHDRGVISLGQVVLENNPDLIRYECIQT
ncbi:MAG: adenylate/guanylate cyclase domain-containing protein [Candidatus Competibacteraceae bacterium]|nr:adenylate/guanylate cyclase domain-containing protein [Candidatus Competibacteraceae bacterium]